MVVSRARRRQPDCVLTPLRGQMIKPSVFILAGLFLGSALAATAEGTSSGSPEIVAVHNGPGTLHALISQRFIASDRRSELGPPGTLRSDAACNRTFRQRVS